MEWLVSPNVVEPKDCAMYGIPCTDLCLGLTCPCNNGHWCVVWQCSPYGGSCVGNWQ